MKTWKVVIVSVVMCVAFLLNDITVFAHLRDEHNKELEAVLFEKGYSKHQSSTDTIGDSIKALEAASYLTIDQFGGKGEETYEELERMNMGGLPRKFSAIDYYYAPGTKEQVNANTHRKYTHQGWDRNYTSISKEVDGFWKTRRKVLLGTVNSIFGFDRVTLFGYGEKCNSFAGIVYYVHILGDYDAADNYKKTELLTVLAGRKNANSVDMDYDIITSLKSYIEILFADQKSSDEYKKLMKRMDKIEKDAGKIVQSVGSVNTEEKFKEYQQYSNDLLELLEECMPELLKREEFFAEVFYPDVTK